MDITLPFMFVVVVGFGTWMLLVTGRQARLQRHLRHLIATQGRRAAWEWYLGTPEWDKTRQATFEAFDWKCAYCGSPHNLQAHHRTKQAYLRLGREKPIRDLTALCAPCHSRAPRSDGLF